jgi:hypothetical protein
MVSFFKGDEERARQTGALIQLDPTQRSHRSILGFLVARLWPRGAEKQLLGEEDPWVRGEMALTQGRFAEAAALLQPEFDNYFRQRNSLVQWIADGLVPALEQSGNSQKALEVLEATSGTRMWTPPASTAYEAFWLRNQARLSSYYHRLGRDADARRVDDQLRKLLVVADADHPILRQLNAK